MSPHRLQGACHLFYMDIEEKDWQKLCALVAKETDPRRLCHLIEQLIKALDARKQELHQTDHHRSRITRPTAPSM